MAGECGLGDLPVAHDPRPSRGARASSWSGSPGRRRWQCREAAKTNHTTRVVTEVTAQWVPRSPRRFVAQDQRQPRGQRSCHAHPLLVPPGELMCLVSQTGSPTISSIRRPRVDAFPSCRHAVVDRR